MSTFVKPIAIAYLATAACAPSTATDPRLSSEQQEINGFEGTFEFILDAPWRMEPRDDDGDGVYNAYDAIPIQVSVFDEDQFDRDTCTPLMQGCHLPVGNRGRLGDACQVNVTRYVNGVAQEPQSYPFHTFADVEKTGLAPGQVTGDAESWWPWSGDAKPFPWRGACVPAEGCHSHYRQIRDTSEWHARVDHRIEDAVGGDTALLELELIVSKELGGCDDPDGLRITLRNWVNVRFAEAPLPRFDDDRWVYGDLHYHAQGNDNEGESGYNYRGVVHGMAAIGMDFVLAAEHASDAQQIIDADLDITGPSMTYRGQRDMSRERFDHYLANYVEGPDGVNKYAVSWWPRTRPIVPQIFMGGEIDVTPLVPSVPAHSYNEPPSEGSVTPPPWPGQDAEWFQPYGNGLVADLHKMCGGWIYPLALGSCPGAYTPPSDMFTELTHENGATMYAVHDVQGTNDTHLFGRQHLVYLPTDPFVADPFVSSSTSDFGGATRHLQHGDGVLEEIDSKGIAFLAHPLAGGEGSSGSAGPDTLPYSTFQLQRAFEHRSLRGLQLWNENGRLETSARLCTPPPLPHSEFPDLSHPDYLYCMNSEWNESGFGHLEFNDSGHTNGWIAGEFELVPQYDLHEWAWERATFDVEHSLHHGTYTWDRMLRWGLDIGRTAPLTWLRDGEPRRVFMAGGSDAHGEFNFRRTGYFMATTGTTSTALGTVRNLVFAGTPRPACIECEPPPEDEPMPHSQQQVSDALAEGRFSVTDGPALRIAIDRDGIQGFTDGDIGMGGVVDLVGADISSVPVLVQWQSTEEWGPVPRIDLYVGVDTSTAATCSDDVCPPVSPVDETETRSRTFAPPDHGARRVQWQLTKKQIEDGIEPDPQAVACADNVVCQMADQYWLPASSAARDSLTVIPQPGQELEGWTIVHLDLRQFTLNHGAIGDRFYVRAFARTRPTDSACVAPAAYEDLDIAYRKGACIERYAYANPVWALAQSWAPGDDCPFTNRGIDGDGDGYPNICDLEPTVPNNDSWSRRIGGNSRDTAVAVVSDALGNSYVGGYLEYGASFDGPTPGGGAPTDLVGEGRDGYVAKYSSGGHLLWRRQLRGSGRSETLALALGNDGNVIATGWFDGRLDLGSGHTFDANGRDAFVTKISAINGEVYWATAISGADREIGDAVAVAPNGRIVVGGYFRHQLRLLPYWLINAEAGYDCFLAWYEEDSGALIAGRPMSGNGNCHIYDLAADSNSAAIAVGKFSKNIAFDPWFSSAGSTRTSPDNFDGFVLKYDATFQYEWHAFLGGISTAWYADANATGVAVDNDDRIHVTGYFRGFMWLSNAFETLAYAWTAGDDDVFVVRLSADGARLAGGGGFGGDGNDYAYGLDVTSDGTAAIAGYYQSSSLWLGDIELTRNAGSDAFAMLVDDEGNATWATDAQSDIGARSGGYDIALHPGGDITLVGRFQQSIRLDDFRILSSAGEWDAFLARLAPGPR